MWPFSAPKLTQNDSVVMLHQAGDALWQGQSKKAISVLTQVIKGTSDHAVHLAYRSLAHRMNSRFSEALADATRAVSLNPVLLEGQFALSVAQLSAGDVVSAVATYNELKTSTVFDVEGHFLNLLAIILYAECIMNMQDTGDGLQLNFVHTPVTRAAIYILDGKATQALYDLSQHADNNLLSLLATALATYRNGLWQNAHDLFRRCHQYVEQTRDPFRTGPSLQALADATARRVSS